jgi:chorismate mutase
MNTLDLHQIAETLESLEETIIFKLIDRAQFRHNPAIYRPGESGFTGPGRRSLFELRLRYQECMDAAFGRFCVPEERPFNSRLPRPKRIAKLPPTGLAIRDYDIVNLTGEIRACYLNMIPVLCKEGADGHFGSSVEHDIYAIQAIARRVHYGAFYVAESKYRSDPKKYQALIDAKDSGRMMHLLTRKNVEERIINRVHTKVIAAQTHADSRLRHVVDPAPVISLYRDYIIPLTKKGEVTYLLNRTR